MDNSITAIKRSGSLGKCQGYERSGSQFEQGPSRSLISNFVGWPADAFGRFIYSGRDAGLLTTSNGAPGERMDLRDGFATGLDTLVGVVIGWLVGSFFKVSKPELHSALARFEQRIEHIEAEARLLVSRAEFQRTIDQLRQDHIDHFAAIRQDVADLRELIMTRLK